MNPETLPPEKKKRFWQHLTAPHPSLESFADRRFSSILSTLLLALLPLYFLPAGIRAIVERHPPNEVLYFGIGVLVLAISYILARSRHPRWGAALTLVYFMLVPFSAIFIYGERYLGDNAKNALVWSVPIMLMALILFRPKDVKWIVFLQVGLYLLVPAVWEKLNYADVLSTLWLVIAVGGLMIVSAFVQSRYLNKVTLEAEKSKINENHFRDLFLNSPVALLEADFSAIKTRLDQFAAEHDDVRDYILQNPESMFGAGQSVRLRDANLRARELYEAKSLQNLLESLHLTVDAEGMIALRDGVIALWEDQSNFPIETTHKTLKGNPKKVVVRFSIRSGYEKSWEYIHIAVDDVTEQRATETSARQLASAVEAAASSIVITDTQGEIEYVNPAFERTTGYSKTEALGNNPRVLKSGEHPTEFYADMWQTLVDGKTWQGELINKKKNGQLYWERATISPLKNEQGETINYVAVKDDISARKEAERRVKTLLQEQIAIRKALEALTSSLDIDIVLEKLAREIGEVVDATSTYIWRWDEATHIGTITAEYFSVEATSTEKVSSIGQKYTETDPNFIKSLINNQHSSAHVGKTKITPKYEDYLKQRGIRSVLYIPIQLQQKTVAFVEVWESRLERDFTPDEIILAQHIAGNAAIAINNARNYEQAQLEIQRRREVERELRKLTNATEQSASGIVITNSNGIIEYANPASAQITGYSIDELLGKTPNILKSGMHEETFYEALWDTIQRGETWRGELINRRKDGSLYWESQVISPVKNRQNEVTHYVAIKEDITVARQTSDQLRVLSNAVQQAANAVAITDPKGYIEFVNPAFSEITDYTVDEVIGKKIGELLNSNEHEPAFYAQLNETIQSGKIWKGEMLNRRKDGSLYWESTVISPVINDDGELAHIVELKEDITKRKELEQALALAHEEALVASDMKTQLLANVSHDMRTPLGGILGYTEMLQAGVFNPLTEEQDKAMRAISSSAQRLLDFVNNLLSQAQIDTGKIVLNKASFNPEKLITSMGGELSFARSKGLTVETHIAEDLPNQIEGDAYWLGQILHNLVSNAIKFTPENGKININIQREGKSHWRIAVSDTGKGIPPQAQEYIFESFRQVDSSIQRETHTGSGLGLSIVQHLVRLMDGEITLESEVEKGSTFTVLLPLHEIEEK
jgi:PAS domain S-box-containing protein